MGGGFSAASGAISEETVFFPVPAELIDEEIPSPTVSLAALPGYPNDPQALMLAARLFTPDPEEHGTGPFPAVIVLHGSGGLWSNDIIANGLISHLEEWGELLAGLGYVALFPDSFNPRGIPGNFSGRRPHWDPAIDDDLCSPNYERPKDVVAALRFLDAQDHVDREKIALIGFSHGAQTGINAILDVSVDLGDYTVSATVLEEVKDSDPPEFVEVENELIAAPSPVRIPEDLPFPKVCVFYYGGGSHYRYHGSANDTGPGRYMFDRRTRVALYHGTGDFLMGVDNLAPGPEELFTGNLFPLKQVLASSAQAQAIGVEDPLGVHLLLDQATHSFDLESIEPPENWDTEAESADEKAKRLCREETLKWLEAHLGNPPQTTIESIDPDAGEVEIGVATSARLAYQWQQSDDLLAWSALGGAFLGSGAVMAEPAMTVPASGRFFRVQYGAAPPPDDPFILPYERFDLP